MTVVRGAGAGLELGEHLRRAGRTSLYVLLGIPQGLVALGLVGSGLVLGALLSVARVGRPLLQRVAAVAWRLGEEERRQANRLLHAHLGPLPRHEARGASPWRSSALRRLVAMLLLRLPVALLALAAAAALVALAAGLLATGIEGLAGDDPRLLGPWALGPALGLALCALAAAATVVTVAALGELGRSLRELARTLLRSRDPAEGQVRELLAERLGDRTLTVAYWLPDRGMFVDDCGRPVELPGPDSGRAWTTVERNGSPVAAIVHAAELDAPPELVEAAAAAASLAIDNERLKADLRARVEELRESRLRIVQASDEARRRIERNLHDGAQQQLVALALDLRLLRARLRDDEARATVEELAGKLDSALAELRDLARGIHPAVLIDRGLAPALEALARRVPLPVDGEVELEARLPEPVEAAAYFVVAEALTNVVRYAQATTVQIDVRVEDGELVVIVTDDGRGGAQVGAGSGLRGLTDRLAALDGRLSVASPPGAGTRLEARIPTHPAAGDAEAVGP